MFDIAEELKKLPQKPGVYLMKNDMGEIIYVGKAINLRNRVRQYFQSSKNHTLKTKSMVPHIAEFEYIVTDSEMEALILECNLIKKHSPRYNIMLKDDKTYPYIKVTLQEDFPRIFATRRREKDKAKYYGPFTDGLAMKETIETLHKLFPIRKCKKVFPRDIGKERPCLNHHIGQCLAPCSGQITKEEYGLYVKDAMDFLEGRHEDILKKMKKEMMEAAEKMEFEKAASLRDKIQAIQSIAQKQKMANTVMQEADVIALVRAFSQCLVQVFFIRDGKMTGRENFTLTAPEEQSRSEIMTAFVTQFYSGTAHIPKEIILQEPLLEEETPLLEEYLSEKRGSKVTFTLPQKGEKQKLVELAYKNANLVFEQFGERMRREEMRTKGAMEEIRQALGLPQTLHRVEAYDISNTQGFESVGSMVVFEDGKAKYSDYRKFKIRTVVGANDFASMQEVLCRRLNHGIKVQMEGKNDSFTRLPDLILMDGGRTQVHAAQEVLAEFGMEIPVCGMVKDDRHRTRGLFFDEREILLPLSSEGFRLVTRIQDEVHRFAITYHRQLRQKKALHSALDDIKGIGQVRRKALMRHFGSVERIAQAEVAELLEVEEMNIPSAEAVYAFFHGD
ncbi:excinuclease ABC subunit UvrC [Anaerotignum lactatifermentans]|uniref:UvrABC system protein C n=1 Tax=Anaerotignum lactatifermentans TaxID=160404 RepID=A0ABS2G8Y6_9FIRM|nr:excinuclease ABC subunit UvrC [Anaerotignum lactatifermentans]MBM6828362.1 excinuclease ABC subunit UvrC [Anaerotignum lactatifermentans]MBM6877642.1 excinuclease ABC subunit UvrC [Anaerotignum lactatifermentans]MBM6949945.1 excinuclease ABC subunit UvrC [Anaerotignum lactatifermentans]